MLHDLYIGEERDPRHDDQFDMNLTTGNLMVRVAEALAAEKDGDEITIVVRTHKKASK
jgi:hypothetical protein